jgi:signal transduction histidine kinase
MESRISSSEAYRFLELLPTGVFIVDPAGRPYYANEEAKRLLGKGIIETRSDGLAEIYSAYVKGEDRLYPTERLPVVQALAGKVSMVEDIEIRRPEKTIQLRVFGMPIFDEQGRIMFGMSAFTDITELNNIQGMLNHIIALQRQTNLELENYNYAMSHDLKAPLRTIGSFSDFLLEDYASKLDETGQDYLQRISVAAAHLTELIDGLLLLAKIGKQDLDVTDVDLDDLMKEIVDDLEAFAKKGSITAVGSLPTIKTEKTWIKGLLMNLITNGLKYNKSASPRVEVSCESSPEGYLFKVHDNGIGIDKQYHDRLFKMFNRLPTEDKYEGTGIGLALCKKIVENLGGRIWLDSEPGEGTTFYFTLPMKPKLTQVR